MLLLLFPAMCWVALRLLRLIHINEGFPDKNQKRSRSAALVEKRIHTQSKTTLKISETQLQLVKKMLWLLMPQCQHGFGRQSTVLSYLHTPSGKKPSRPGQLEGDRRWRIWHNEKNTSLAWLKGEARIHYSHQ